MEFVRSYRRIGTASAAIAMSAGMIWFGNGLEPVWPLIWVASIPVLLVALRGPSWISALPAGVAWFVGTLTLWRYLRALSVPVPAIVSMALTVGLVALGGAVLCRALARRGAIWSALLAFPVVFVSFEFVRSLLTPHGTAGSLAYTQLEFLPILQLASLTGAWGITFVMMLVSSAIALALSERTRKFSKSGQVLLVAGGVLGAVVLYGSIRLTTAPAGNSVPVALLASDEPQYVNVAAAGPDANRLFAGYADQVRRLALYGTEFVVLPEKLAVVLDDDPTADSLFQAVADESRATVVVGQIRVRGRARFNQARVFTPHEPVRAYDKHHMLPPFESDLTVGTSMLVIDKRQYRVGIEICKDLDFTHLARRYAEAGVAVVLAPAWDFNMDRTWHGHIAIMRGVENGFSVVRAAKNGYLTISDDRGRILNEVRSDSKPFATLMAWVPARHGWTLYSVCGDWFAYLCAIMLIGLIGRATSLVRTNKDKQGRAASTRVSSTSAVTGSVARA